MTEDTINKTVPIILAIERIKDWIGDETFTTYEMNLDVPNYETSIRVDKKFALDLLIALDSQVVRYKEEKKNHSEEGQA